MSAAHDPLRDHPECPSHCERLGCGERPVNVQRYPLEFVADEWICSRHKEYPARKQPAEQRQATEQRPVQHNPQAWDV